HVRPLSGLYLVCLALRAVGPLRLRPIADPRDRRGQRARRRGHAPDVLPPLSAADRAAADRHRHLRLPLRLERIPLRAPAAHRRAEHPAASRDVELPHHRQRALESPHGRVHRVLDPARGPLLLLQALPRERPRERGGVRLMTAPASLHGHAALVTGAGRNIGRAIALALAARGCDVVVNTAHRRADAEAVAVDARKHGVRAVVAVGDVGRRDDVSAIVGAAGEIGTVDIVVNNAAIRPRAPFLEMTDAEWQRVIDVDLSAAFYMARAFAPAMVARGWGRIVNITGMNAMQGTHD